MSDHRRGRRRRWGALHHGITAGLAVFLLLVGSGVSYAAWTRSTTATNTAGAATLGVSTTGFASNVFTFQNHQLSTTGSVTLTNTTVTQSMAVGTYSMTLGYTGDAALAAKLAVAVWPTTAPSGCPAVTTPPGTAVTGSWSTVATTVNPLTGSLAKNATASYCIRVTGAERGELASSTGVLSIQPSVSASLKVGNWIQSAGATTTQKTAWIFPAFGPTPNTWYQIVNQATLNCLDVYSASLTSGTGVIDYTCKTGNAVVDYNQEWSFARSAGDYYDITPRHDQTLRMDAVGSSTMALAAVDVETDNDSRLSQEWQLQAQPGSVYQLVNRNSGLCLQVNDTDVYVDAAEYAQTVCDGSAGQRYALVVKDVTLPSMTIACAPAAGGGVTLGWTGAAIDTYDFQSAPNGGNSWTSIGGAAPGSTAITVLPSSIPGADGQYTARALWLTNLLATTTLWKSTVGGSATLSCSAPATLQCVLTGSGSNTTVVFAFSPTAPQSFKLQVRSTATTWVDMMNGAYYSGTNSVTITGNPPLNLADGAYPVRAVTSGGSTIGTSQLVVSSRGSSANRQLTCS
ncbi:RICIN domain-containing protein [Terrimesophilobacter mesophilus]|uniref:Ricin B lectin domain-containing protein n=1 Tax=Terrimesophilobacter mesophilus TaxID=433647 RepID=A0A4R8V820_9MICO|nr:RICIN domain-containing protein [Terrimesophilobacter mesophilus]TFB79291.1 hypothetical protein E3N84_04015 [Terrimesophilobacter mesophilus]